MIIAFYNRMSEEAYQIEARQIGDFFELDWPTAGTYTLRRSKERAWRSSPTSLLKKWRLSALSEVALNKALAELAEKRRLETKSRCGLT